jgi:hypothetical protein
MTPENIIYYETEHKDAPGWTMLTSDGKYIITTSFRESIVWDVKTMKPIFDEGIRFIGLFSHNKIGRGVIQDGLYMKWKASILTYYQPDLKIDNDD